MQKDGAAGTPESMTEFLSETLQGFGHSPESQIIKQRGASLFFIRSGMDSREHDGNRHTDKQPETNGSQKRKETGLHENRKSRHEGPAGCA